VRTRRGEDDELGVRRPLEEPPEIVTVGIQGAAGVARQEGNGGELRFIDDEAAVGRLDGRRRGLDDCHGCSSS